NESAKEHFGGKRFLDLDAKQREEYLHTIMDEHKITDAALRKDLMGFYRAARSRIMTVYYQNYPESAPKHKPNGEVVFAPGDTNQSTPNPNTTKVVTGWDVAGYAGPVNGPEETQLREMMKKQLLH